MARISIIDDHAASMQLETILQRSAGDTVLCAARHAFKIKGKSPVVNAEDSLALVPSQ